MTHDVRQHYSLRQAKETHKKQKGIYKRKKAKKVIDKGKRNKKD